MDQESNLRQPQPVSQPQHLTQMRTTISSSPSSSMSKPLSTGRPTTHRLSEELLEASAVAVDASIATSSSRHYGQLKKDTGQSDNNNSAPRMPLTADQFSSSLASIASTSARQALHHQQSSSSSSDSSREAMVVTATATENSASNTSNNSSNSGSGEENREFGGNTKTNDKTSVNNSHHHAHPSRRTKRGDNYGLPLRVNDDRLQQHGHAQKASANHASVVAQLPPLASESSLSSSGNETSSVPAYHTIKLTLQNTNKTITSSSSCKQKKKRPCSKTSKKQPSQQETTSSDSSGSLMRHHHHHHHASKRPVSSTNPKDDSAKKKKLKTSPPKSTSMARKKRRGESSTENTPLQAPRATATDAEDDENYGSNSSSGSGTEAGYAGSASSNENKGEGSNGSSTSNSSSDIPDFSSGASESNAYPFATSPSNSPSLSSSNGDDDEDDISEDDRRKTKRAAPVAASKAQGGQQWLPHLMKMEPQQPQEQDRKLPAEPAAATSKEPPSNSILATAQSHFAKISRAGSSFAATTSKVVATAKPKARRPSYSNVPTQLVSSSNGKPPILTLGSDLMAHVLTFLEPPEILRVLTMPLSRDWSATFAGQQELWRVLCLLEPFKAQVEEEDFSSSSSSSGSSSCDEDDEDDDGSLSSFSVGNGNVPPATVWKSRKGKSSRVAPIRRSLSNLKPAAKSKSGLPKLGKLGKYRLLYTSFVRCMKYLARMKEDVLHGRPPSIQDYGRLPPTTVITSPRDAIGSNRSLQQFLAGARGVVESQNGADAGEPAQDEEAPVAAAASMPIMSADDGSSSYQSSVERRRKRKKSKEVGDQKRRKKPKFGRSMLTDRLLGPTPSGDVNPDNVALPWSCALYSIVNWMVAFADVEGIQVMCLKVLPYLLEDEQQRITAQRVGLTDVILRGMILFPDNVQLHTASFHTLVLLARPLGGREGMLFHSSMVNATGIFSGGEARNGNNADGEGANEGATISGGPQNDGKNGIAVMLDSMRRFEADGALQAMSCWSLVNIALAPVQKEVLVKLGGIEATTNAMMRHPHNAEVQFRALFALINLVIPSVNVSETNNDNQDNAGDVEGFAAELDEAVGQITNLVVVAMKNFCASEAILNRACLVLHNLSLTQAYHSTLLWTPNCYQMLEWCLANYRTDQVLQQSAAGTLHRLQVTLSNDENLRTRFAASIQAQQQLSLEAAHREALHIYEQQEQLRQERQGRSAASARGVH